MREKPPGPKSRPNWEKRRADAIKARAARTRRSKKRDAIAMRFRQHETIGRTIARLYGIEGAHARDVALAVLATPEALRRLPGKGGPAVACELYEAIERIKRYFGGTLPTGKRFWDNLALQWNSGHFEARPERMYLTPEGKPHGRRLQSAYLVAARKLETKAKHIVTEHALECLSCRAAVESPRPESTDWPDGLPRWLKKYVEEQSRGQRRRRPR